MPPPDSLTRALLEESAWLQRLAARLVAEPAGAADAAQETLAKALQRAPAEAVSLRRWLAAVLRNVVRQERRTTARREARELSRPAALEAEPADELAARLELHEKLVAAVRGLEEPYRTTIALRFLEDLPPKAVAERMDVPVKTVHTRIERALEQLRARLDREHGGRGAWAGLLLPLSIPRPPLGGAAPLATLAPALAMGTLWKWTGACAALAVLGLLTVRSLAPEPRASTPARAAELPVSAALAPPAATVDVIHPAGAREAVAAEPARTAPTDPAPAVASTGTLAGLVLDIEHRPVAGLTVSYERLATTPSRPDPEAPIEGEDASDERGRFELPLPDGSCRIVARGRGYATAVAPGVAGTPSPEPPIVFVGPERSYAGRVTDEQGSPVAGAELTASLDPELARGLTPGSFAASLPIARALSDEDGRFALPSVGGALHSRLFAGREGLVSAEIELPEGSSSDLVLVLASEAPLEHALGGHVVHADGRPAPGAYVSTGAVAARASEDGAFQLALEAGAEPARLHAVLAGFLPAELELAGLDAAARAELVLVLGGAARTITGRVVDGRGEPLAGARVWTTDGERFGEITTRTGDFQADLSFDFESVMAGARLPQEDGRRALCDGRGVFVLKGLGERRYGLHAFHPRTQELVGPVEVASGSDGVVLTLAGAEPAHAVAGRVTTFSGEPVPGASVRVLRLRRTSSGRTSTYRVDPSFRALTDAEGRFRFAELCTAGTELLVTAEGFSGETPCALDSEPDLEDVLVRMPAACHVRLFLEESGSADSLMLEDERGEDLLLTLQLGGVLLSANAITLEGDVSDLITTDERARTLVLKKGREVVARIPLLLHPGQVNEIRF
jgi:RNA polymerase sigma-70 factor (ECF subfamily)